MMLLDTAHLVGIIAIAIVGAALLGLISFLLGKYVFARNAYSRQIKELDRRYSFLNALLIGQDSQYIKRLEMISRVNLLYGEKYDTYSKRFKHIKEIDNSYAEGVIKQLKSLIESKKYSQIKKALIEGKKALNILETNVHDLDAELSKLIEPEEEARQTALNLKEALRDIKQTYKENITDLEPVSGTFDLLFAKLDKRFNDFEACLEGANYDEAKVILPEIGQVLKQLKRVMGDLPGLCVLVSQIIPTNIKKLKQEAEDLHAKKYPLYHLMLTNEFSVYNDKLNQINEALMNLSLKTVRNLADSLQKDIDDMHAKFEKEVTAKEFFLANVDSVYQNVLNLEKRFLRLCSLLPEMDETFKVDAESKQNIDNLKEGVSRLGNAKQSLDGYIHSATPQAYSILQAKLETLMKDYDEVNKGTQDFKVFMDSLRTTSEDAYSLVFAYYYRLRLCEQQLNTMGIKVCKDKYENSINQCYDLLNDIEAKIKVPPIDTAYINQQVENLKTIANELFDSVAKEANVVQMAESAILIANRDRKHQSDVHQNLLIAEDQFFQGEVEKSYHDVVSLIKRSHIEDNQGN